MIENNEIKVNYTPSVIEIDGRSEIEKEVSELVEKSKNYVVTVETITDARDMRAKLNGMFNTLEDRRKDVKNKINEPYDEFKKVKIEIQFSKVLFKSLRKNRDTAASAWFISVHKSHPKRYRPKKGHTALF